MGIVDVGGRRYLRSARERYLTYSEMKSEQVELLARAFAMCS